MKPTVGSLFSGIGGLELGLERAGFRVAWQVERDPYCQKILTKHWPEVPKYDDVFEVSAGSLETVDVICGGFPCQPVSHAGRKQAQADPRWLWPEFARLVDELRPRFVIVENVPGLWTTTGGAEVVSDLATLGYDCRWDRLFAATVGAPHLRERVFIVAHTISGAGRGERGLPGEPGGQGWEAHHLDPEPSGAIVADPDSRGQQVLWLEEHPPIQGPSGDQPDRRSEGGWGNGKNLADPVSSGREGWPWQFWERGWREPAHSSPVWRQDPAEIPESGVGRVANGVPNRLDRLRVLGNAVVPQVAEVIGHYVMAAMK